MKLKISNLFVAHAVRILRITANCIPILNWKKSKITLLLAKSFVASYGVVEKEHVYATFVRYLFVSAALLITHFVKRSIQCSASIIGVLSLQTTMCPSKLAAVVYFVWMF